MKRSWSVFVLMALLGLLPAEAVSAAGACTVPSAAHPTIQSAIADPACDPVNVKAGTFHENLFIERSVRITGAGINATTIDGLGTGSTVRISDLTSFTIMLEHLTVTGGTNGGISAPNATHALNLTEVRVAGNQATEGGGLHLEASHLVVTDGAISGNTASTSVGGGAYIGSGDVRLDGVRIEGNTAATQGGGLYMGFGGTMTMVRSVIEGNSAASVGGAYVFSPSMSMLDSAVVGNTATAGSYGGFLAVASEGLLTMTNVTVSGNRATGGDGGFLVDDLSLDANHVTISNNVADSDSDGNGDSGGMRRSGGSQSVTLRNTILAGNRDASPGAEAPDCGAVSAIGSAGSNIIGTTQGCAFNPGPGDQIGVDPKLAPLADNGGGTPTHALQKGSPAIDAADAPGAAPTDQRGLTRSDADIGAYELVYCLKVPVNRIGTDGKDKLKGTNKADGMLGMGGKDTLNGKGGKDGLCGGGGKDTLKGGGGVDRMKGQGGKDRCVGGGGNDKAVCEEERSV